MKKVFRIAGILVLGLTFFVLIAALFVNKEYKVERSITINQPKQVVFDYTRYLKNQDNFSVWSKMDPNMKKDYRGTDGTIGFVSAWDSKKKEAGTGEQEITGITDNERIDYEIRFLKPMKSTDDAYLLFNDVSDNVTSVTWGFNGKLNYPMNLMLAFMDMDSMLGKDLEQGLVNLKSIMEKQ